MMDDKGFVASIVKKVAPSDDEEAPQKTGGLSEGLLTAAEDVLAALGDKDAERLGAALKAFCDLAAGSPDEEG